MKDIRAAVIGLGGMGRRHMAALDELAGQGVRTVHLVPLMSVAGDHAHNDMAGSEPDSWVSILKAKGFTPKAQLTGLGSRPAVAKLWINHLKDAVKDLDH